MNTSSLKALKILPFYNQTRSKLHTQLQRCVLLSSYYCQSTPANVQKYFQSSDANKDITFTDRAIEFEANGGGSIFTDTEDPSKHSPLDVGLIYRLSDESITNLSLASFLMKEYISKTKAFHETALLIREPAIEVISMLNKVKPTDLVHRIVLYGKKGVGKSATFIHCLDAAHNSGWFIIKPLKSYNWNIHYKELAISNYNASRYDIPQEAVEFLMNIRRVNKRIFAEYNDSLVTTHEYTWSRRENTPVGTSIAQLLDYGIERPKYACDVVGAFLKELRLNGNNWPFKTLVAIDGVNSLFGHTDIKIGEKRDSKLPTIGISLIHHLVKLLKCERTNGAVLTTVGQMSAPMIRRESHLPKYLLGEDGFEAMDPFLLLEVPFYDNREINKVLDYLTEKQWIQTDPLRSDHGRKELIYLSANNPRDLEMITRSL